MASAKHLVRPATVDDAAGIAEVHIASWRAAYVDVIPKSYLDRLDVAQRTQEWDAILRGEVHVDGVGRPTDLVIEDGGKVVGFADIGDFRDVPSPAYGELWSMYVHPDHWRGGYGSALMEATLSHLAANGRQVGFLWVLTENPLARNFYEKWGWVLDDSRDDPVEKTFEIDGTIVNELRYRIDL